MFSENYEEFPKWYEISMIISASLTTPINILGLFMIAFYAKNQMKDYLYYLLFHQICSLFTDVFLNSGTVPVIYSPFAIGTPHGWMTGVFRMVGVENSTSLQVAIVFFCIMMTALSIELLFFYRYQVILPLHHPWKLAKLPKFLAITIFQILWTIFGALSFHNVVANNQEAAKNLFRCEHPDYAFFVDSPNSLIVAMDTNFNAVLFLSICISRMTMGAIICTILIILSRHALDNMAISLRTRNMHLSLIRTLCYQISIPLAVFYIPVLGLIIPLVFKIQNTFYICLASMNIQSYHTFFGTFSLLYFNRPWMILKKAKCMEVINTSNSLRRNTKIEVTIF